MFNIDLPITVDDLKKRQKYQIENVSVHYLNCHIGHRKLFCAVLEFLVECQKHKINLDDSFIIYIGSAPGISLNIISKLYPKLLWLLYDKNAFLINNNNNNFIFKNQYFEDDDIDEAIKIFKKSKRKNFLFICDMRISPDENAVFDDMTKQQEWLLKLDCVASCLKFRLPWVFENNDEEYKKMKVVDNKMLYLDGKVFIQAYAPKRSTETRLISFAPFKEKSYDILEYEEKMSYFNLKTRNEEFLYENSEDYVFNSTYDEVLEYYIMDEYNKINKKFKNMFQFYNMIDYVFRPYKITNNVNCKMKAFINNVKAIINDDTLSKEQKEKSILFLIEKMEKIIKKINLFKNNKKNNFKNLIIKIDEVYIKKNDKNDLFIDKPEIMKSIK